jgi:hypothetical protein
MKKLFCSLMAVLVFLAPLAASAADNTPQPSTFQLALVAEGVFIAASAVASREPRAFGVVSALMFPAAVLGSDISKPTSAVALIGAETLAFYNISVNKNDRTRQQIFRKNMIGWHALALVVGVTGYIMGDYGSNQSLALVPAENHGAKIMYSYNF